ncbi:MAG: NAD(P)-binding domain-containing protein [Burkholderiales bacterium]
MRSFLVFIGVLGVFFSAPVAARTSSDQGPAIQVLEGDWGNADTGEIETLLHSVASELWRFFPERSPSKLVVIASEKGPLALYRRGPNGEYVILLSAKNRRWVQYAYQFSHELCHVLSNHDHHAKPNQWFEEAMCEAAAVFTLRSMASTWESNPPFPDGENYVHSSDADCRCKRLTQHQFEGPKHTLAVRQSDVQATQRCKLISRNERRELTREHIYEDRNFGRGQCRRNAGTQVLRNGHEVFFGVPNPRDEKHQTLVSGIGSQVGTVEEAARSAETIPLAVPYEAVDALRECGDLNGKILIDATNTLKFTEGSLNFQSALKPPARNG